MSGGMWAEKDIGLADVPARFVKSQNSCLLLFKVVKAIFYRVLLLQR